MQWLGHPGFPGFCAQFLPLSACCKIGLVMNALMCRGWLTPTALGVSQTERVKGLFGPSLSNLAVG